MLNIDIILNYRTNRENIRGYEINFTGNYISDMAKCFNLVEKLNNTYSTYQLSGVQNIYVRVCGTLKFQFSCLRELVNHYTDISDLVVGKSRTVDNGRCYWK